MLYFTLVKTILYVKSSERTPSLQKCDGFRRGAALRSWRVHVITLPPEQASDIPRLIAFWKADGLVLDCGGFAAIPSRKALGTLPTVFFSLPTTRGEHAFAVGEDAKETADAAARELLQLGYAHYAFVHYPTTRDWSCARAEAFKEAILLNGGTCAEFRSDDKATPLAWAQRLRQWIRELPRPCGIFAANDEVAHHVRGICAVEGLDIPNAIALVGVDNDATVCVAAQPRLSSVLADNEQMGFRAAGLLAEQFKDSTASPHRLFVPPLMVIRRESTRRLVCQDTQVLDAIRLIREKACSGLRARDVLALFPGSRRAAEMRFREATGHSVLDEIQRVRTDRARELLADGSRPLKTLANLCGYASESAFRKVYFARFGVPPRRRLG